MTMISTYAFYPKRWPTITNRAGAKALAFCREVSQKRLWRLDGPAALGVGVIEGRRSRRRQTQRHRATITSGETSRQPDMYADTKLAAENELFLEPSAKPAHAIASGHVARMAQLAGARLIVNSDNQCWHPG